MRALLAVKQLFRKGAVEIAVVSLATALGQIATLVAIVMIGRLYGVAEVGKASLVLALGGVASGLFDFGTSAAWVRNSAVGDMGKEQLANLLGRKISYGTVLFASISTAAFLAFPSEPYYLFGVVACALILGQSVLVGLRADSRNFALGFILLLEKSVFLSLFLALLYFTDHDGVYQLVLSQILSALFAMLIASFLLGRRGFPRPNFGSPSEIWFDNRYFGFSSVATTAQRLDIPLITAASGDFTAGQYGAVNRWTQPMGLLTQTFSLVVVPYAAREKSIRGGLAAVGIAKQLPVLAVLICAVVFLFAGDLVKLIMGEGFDGSVAVLRLLAVSTALGSLNQPLAALLQAVGQEKGVSVVVVAGVMVSLILTVPLVLIAAAPGAAVALMLGQTIIAIGLVTLLYIRKRESSI